MSPVSSTRPAAASILNTQLWLFARAARPAGTSESGWRNSKETPSQSHPRPEAQGARGGRGGHGPGGGGGGCPARAGNRGEPVEHRHQDFENRVPQRERPVEGERGARKRERRDDEAHQRYRERVGDRRDERYLLKQHEQQRR